MIVLGSTGSIGTSALEIAKRYHLKVEALVAGHNLTLLNQQILSFSPKKVVIATQEEATKITPHFKGELYYGNEGIKRVILESQSQLVVNALVGFLGLVPTLWAISSGKKVALANKESLVVGGNFIDTSKIIPIDSEHFGLMYLMNFNPLLRPIRKLYITASGGAFRDLDLSLIPSQKAQEALKHPNWKMGKKITIESATMVNKLFEVLEAYYLFKTKSIEGRIERNSHIHALVEFWDGSVVAHLANANMQLPIAYALAYGLGEDFLKDFFQNFSHTPIIDPLDFSNTPYQLSPIDTKRYPLWDFKKTLLDNPQLGVVLNASSEIAIEAFLQDKITFGKIAYLIESAMDSFSNIAYEDIEEILTINQQVRDFTLKLLENC